MIRSVWLLMGAVALSALACAAPTSPAGPPGAGVAQQEQPVPGGVLRRAEFGDFYDFDPTYNGSGTPNPTATMLANETLVALKTGPDVPWDDTTLVPWLAERWEVSPDAKAFTFHLRKGVKFANGRELTSQDVKFTFEYSARQGLYSKLPRASYGFAVEGLTAVETPDASTVVVRFDSPFVPFLSYTAAHPNHILNREIYDQDGHFKDRMGGTGPFQLDMSATQKGTKWVFKKNPNYWQQGQPYLDEMHVIVIPEEPTRVAGFIAKQLQAISVSHAIYSDMRGKVPSAVVVQEISPDVGSLFMSMSPAHPVMHEPKLRKAIALALNYEAFNQLQSGGVGGWPITGVPASWFPQEQVKQVVKYDPERAKQLVREAYPNGVSLTLVSSAAGSTGVASSADQLLQANLKSAGIDVTIATPQTPERRRRLYSGDYDILLISDNPFMDPDSYFFLQYHPKGGGHWAQIKDPKLAQWVEAERAEVNVEKRKQIFWEMAKHLTENGLHVGVYRPVSYGLYHPEVRNYHPHWRVEGIKAGGVWLQR